MEKNYHTDNNSFVVYKDWEELVRALDSDADRGRLFLALFLYASTGKQPVDFSGALKMAFLVMKNAIDRDGHKWEQTCENRAINGKRGGAPKGNQNARKKQAKQPNGCLNNLKQAKQPDTDTETEIETDTDTVSDSEKETEIDTVLPSADDFSAVELSDDQLSSLVSFSSRPLVDFYIAKAKAWQIKNKRKYKDPYKTIKGWIEADKAKNPTSSDKTQSYDINKIQAMADSFVQRNSKEDNSSA